MINMNEYWNASPLRPDISTVTCVFSFCRLLSLKTQITVFMRIYVSDAYKCVYVIVQS